MWCCSILAAEVQCTAVLHIHLLVQLHGVKCSIDHVQLLLFGIMVTY